MFEAMQPTQERNSTNLPKPPSDKLEALRSRAPSMPKLETQSFGEQAKGLQALKEMAPQQSLDTLATIPRSWKDLAQVAKKSSPSDLEKLLSA